jgi:nitroreductase
MSFTETPPLHASPFPAKPADTSVPILDPIANRWSPSRFDDSREVEWEDLLAILEAARWAPSSFGEQPWRFIVGRRRDLHREVMDSALSSGNAYARRAGVLIATLAKTTYTRNGRPNRHATHDTGLATANLLLEATSRGLVTHPIGGFDRQVLREAFDIPEDYVPVAMVAVGHHDPSLEEERLMAREDRPRRRRPLEQTVFGTSFGSPLTPSGSHIPRMEPDEGG